LGVCLAAYLIVDSGATQVAHAMLVVGWCLIPISLYHLVPMTFSALSWRKLLPGASPLGAGMIVRIRWIRESINSLLPVAGIGGDLASIRLVHLKGVLKTQAAASTVVDTTVGAVTLLIFVVAGVALLLMRSSERGILDAAGAVLLGAAVFIVLIAAFVAFQHRGLFSGLAKFVRRLLPKGWQVSISGGASAVDEAVVAVYRNKPVIVRAGLLRLIGWAAGAGEVWLVMRSLGNGFGFTDSFILESLNAGIRGAAFLVPAALGAQEGGLVLFGALLGLSPEFALAISLSKRVRELALGLPGLVVWHWIEGHYFIRHNACGEPTPR
jgi:putative membrane protein